LAVTATVKGIVRPIESLDKNRSARDGAQKMLELKIGSVVVGDGGRFVGIVTERDLLEKVIAAGKDPAKITLGEVMSSPLITVEAGAGLGEATSLMLQKNVRRLIATENGKIVGIFTQRDLQGKVYDVFRSLTGG
jgi:signal-transduction protein with cAMP-binding, CBS, and nucleotidyltransferase domain